MQKKERVILIQGDDTKWYEQVIFIVNPNTSEIPTDFVAEAEKIIYNYKNNINDFKTNIGIAYDSVPFYSPKLSRLSKWAKFFKSKLFDWVLNISMAIGCIILATIIALGLFN